MRKAILALVLLSSSTPALAQKGGGDFGLGLQVGAPTGLNGKYYMDRFAFQFGLGVVERGWDDGLHIFADALFHPVVITEQRGFTMPLYVGVGARLLEDDNDDFFHCHGNDCYWGDYDSDTHAGVRIPVGLLMAFHKVPLDAFLELAPTFDFLYDDDGYDFCHEGHCHDYDDDRLSIYVTLGARWYF